MGSGDRRAYAGPVATVDRCRVRNDVILVTDTTDGTTHKGARPAAPAPCTIEVGLGMTPGFHSWVSGSLAATQPARTVQLVRVDGKPYALELAGATLSAFNLPKVDRAALAPAFFQLAISAERIRRTAAPALPAEALTQTARGFTPAAVDLNVNGQPVQASSVGPWSAEIPLPAVPDGARDYVKRPQPAVIGDLTVRVPEALAVAVFDPWLQAMLAQDKIASVPMRPLTLAFSDGKAGRTELTLDRPGVAKGDLAPRADGSRSYDVYAERAAITAR